MRTDNHYEHISYHMGINANLEDSPLPQDKRFKPWPSIRKYNMVNVKTEGQYLQALIDRSMKHREEHLKVLFKESK